MSTQETTPTYGRIENFKQRIVHTALYGSFAVLGTVAFVPPGCEALMDVVGGNTADCNSPEHDQRQNEPTEPTALEVAHEIIDDMPEVVVAEPRIEDMPWFNERVHQYRDLIEEYADEAGEDPDLVEILIAQESSGFSDAESSKGAIGLGQTMPETQQEIAETIGVSRLDLTDPADSIRAAAWYLAILRDRYGMEEYPVLAGEPDSGVIAAYNGGPGHVRDHIENGEQLYNETQNYVESIIGKYKQLSPRRTNVSKPDVTQLHTVLQKNL